MNKKIISYLLVVTIVVGALGITLVPEIAHAQAAGGIIQNIRGQAETFNQQNTGLPGDANTDPVDLVGKIITYLLTLLGIVFLVLVLWGGAQWMLSGGDPKKVEGARKRIVSAAVGIAVIVLSLAIVQFVLQILEKTTV